MGTAGATKHATRGDSLEACRFPKTLRLWHTFFQRACDVHHTSRGCDWPAVAASRALLLHRHGAAFSKPLGLRIGDRRRRRGHRIALADGRYGSQSVGNWMRARCDEVGLPQCTSHGVRKIAATKGAEGGATVHRLMSIFDWVTLQQAEAYTREANRRRLAQSSMHLLAAPFASGGPH